MTLVLVIKLLMGQLSKPLSQSSLCNLIPDYMAIMSGVGVHQYIILCLNPL